MQVTVQTLKAPLPGKTNAGFMGTDGKFYKCDIGTWNKLAEGMTFEANVKPSEYNGQTYYWLPRGFNPPNTVGAIIPQPQTTRQTPPGDPGYAPLYRPNGNGYVPKDEDLITRLAILKSLIESGALLKGMGMDDLIALAWETAPKLKVWPK